MKAERKTQKAEQWISCYKLIQA